MQTPVRIESGLGLDPAYLGLEADRAVLVRPDGHVAWRSPAQSEDRVAAVSDALVQVLGRRYGLTGIDEAGAAPSLLASSMARRSSAV